MQHANKVARVGFAALAPFLVVVVSSVVAAPAQAGEKSATQKAKAHFDMGTAYFNLEKYNEALQEFEAAYIDRQDPTFLYGIAQCHRLTGKKPEAIRFYQKYLQEAPPGHANRTQAEQYLRELQAGGSAPPPVAPVAVPPPPPAVVAVPPPPPPRPAPAQPPPPQRPAPAQPPPPAPAQPPLQPLGWNLPVAAPPPAPAAAPPPPVASAPPAPAPGAPVLVAAPAPAPAETSTPVYKKWWFWALIGVVAVGGVVAGVSMSQEESPSCPTGRMCF